MGLLVFAQYNNNINIFILKTEPKKFVL